MGDVLPEALAAAGVKATFLNHAENPCTVHELASTIARAKEVGILTVVCADSVEEGEWIAHLHPDVMVCELTSLIGTGQVAGEDYMRSSIVAVKRVSPETKVLQAAGISTGEDVYNAIMYGADSTGGTSGIVAAEDPFATLDEMFEARRSRPYRHRQGGLNYRLQGPHQDGDPRRQAHVRGHHRGGRRRGREERHQGGRGRRHLLPHHLRRLLRGVRPRHHPCGRHVPAGRPQRRP